MNEKTARGIARGLACGCLSVLRQWFNRLVCSCLIVKNMFVKLKTKEYCKQKIADVMFLKVSEYEDHL